MIHYNSLWETMSNKHFTTYTLREKHNIGHGTVQRLQKNMPVSTYTLDRLCKILDCRLDEVAEYLPDEEAEKINKKGNDSLSPVVGNYVAEESDNVHSAREAWNESCNRSAATSGSACVNAYLE